METCWELKAKRSTSCGAGEDADLAREPPLLGFLFLYLGYISFPNTLRMFDPGHHTRVLIAAAL